MLKTLNSRKFLILFGDILLLYLSLLATIFFGFGGELKWKWVHPHLMPFSILYACWLVIFYVFGLYDLKIIKTSFFYTKVIGALLTALGWGIIFFYLATSFDITPRTNLAFDVLMFGVLLVFWRKIFYSLFSSRLVNRVAIVGEGPQTQELAKEILKRPYLGYKLITLNANQELLPQIKEEKIDTLIIPDDLASNSGLVKKLYQSLPARISFMNWAMAYETICEKIPVSFVAQTWFLENIREGEKKVYDKAKRGTDVILAGILLVITSPLFLLIGLAIKLTDRGPIFYNQERIGKDGKPFYLLKFRSMKIGAESKTGAVWAKKEDPRTTKVGKLLRRIHLDELPQMINVLKGEISLVGPRPERPEFVVTLEKEIPHYHIRHLIRPGFTGWAQLKFRYGRSVMDSKEKFQYDLYYLKNRSWLLDLRILLKTFQLFFKRE